MIEFALGRADAICSTSDVMRAETTRHTDKAISVTPFGVDTAAFAPAPRPPDGRVVFGIVKTMDAKYGIDVLLQAFADMVSGGAPGTGNCDLVVVGGGPKLADQELAASLGISAWVRFTGRVPHEQVLRWSRPSTCSWCLRSGTARASAWPRWRPRPAGCR